MNRTARVLFSFLIIVLAGSASAGVVGPATSDTRGRILDNVYTSPSGSFRLRIPKLLNPGAKVRDEIPAPGVLLVSFTDDLCREFIVSEEPGNLGSQSLEAWVDENVVENLKPLGVEVRERKVLQTRNGIARGLRYQHPGAAPCGNITFREGKRVDTKPDADVGMYVLYADGVFYRLIYVKGVGPGLGDSAFDIQRGPVDELLARFADGFEIVRIKAR